MLVLVEQWTTVCFAEIAVFQGIKDPDGFTHAAWAWLSEHKEASSN